MKKNDFLKENLLFFKKAEATLLKKKIPSARYEAEELVKFFSRMTRLQYFTGERVISARQKALVLKALKKRSEGQPLGYILKETNFFGLKFFLNRHTLIPRPETELLVDSVLEAIKDNYQGFTPQILDLCTGSGCIAVSLTIQRPGCRMTALDISAKALQVARKNINFHGLRRNIQLVKSDLFKAFGNKKRFFWDIIVSNPPYVPEEDFPELSREVLLEPSLALDGGPKGLVIIDRILNTAPCFLKKNGWLFMEIGYGQASILRDKLKESSDFKEFFFIKDFSGIDRILVAKKS